MSVVEMGAKTPVCILSFCYNMKSYTVCHVELLFAIFVCLRQGLTLQIWLAWNSLSIPGWP